MRPCVVDSQLQQSTKHGIRRYLTPQQVSNGPEEAYVLSTVRLPDVLHLQHFMSEFVRNLCALALFPQAAGASIFKSPPPDNAADWCKRC